MKNLLMLVLSIALISSSQITFANNGGNDVCCNKTEVAFNNVDLANEINLNVLNSETELADTSDNNKRKVESIIPLYDLSLSFFAVEPSKKAEKPVRIIEEFQPLYDLSLASFSVEKIEQNMGNNRKVVLGNPLYDLSLSNFAVKQNEAKDLMILAVR